MAETLIGLYDDLTTAQHTIQALVNAGFAPDRIRLFATSAWQNNGSPQAANIPTDYMPGGQWATMQNLPTNLTALDIPASEARVYAEAVRRGGVLVVLGTESHEAAQAMDIMQRFHPLDIDQRLRQWQASGWTDFQPEAAAYTADLIAQERERFRAGSFQEGTAALPIVEEELVVGKRQVAQGGVRIRSLVTERPVEQSVQLRSEQVTVERRPVDRSISPGTPGVFEETTLEVRAAAEEAVVTKRAHVIEEVVIRKDVAERTETVRDTVRRTDVAVEQVAAQPSARMATFQSFDADFRQHYQTHAASSGYPYEQYVRVYQFGYALGNDERYHSGDWASIASQARRYWEERNAVPWEQVESSVRYAWEKARSSQPQAV